jgi:sugar phosphate isomerase/epimerase
MSRPVGIDSRKIPRFAEDGPLRSLDLVHSLGLNGIFYRTVLDMSPTLDLGALREIKAHASSLGLYVESGLGKINPYATPEAPELRAIGGGDILRGFERMLRACAEIDCHEVWVSTANYKDQYVGMFAYDRFRTDAPWADQLAATERFARLLAPIARDLGTHMNVETHEEITSFEVVRLVEAVGPDVMGVTFDVANVLQRGEDPLGAAHRVAPYVRQAHLKDAVLFFVDEGLRRQERPCGQGIVDYPAILPLLLEARPALNLSIELCNTQSLATLQIYDRTWLASHTDLPAHELTRLVRLARECERRFASGEATKPMEFRAQPFEYAEQVEAILACASYLRSVIDADESTLDRAA